MLAPRLFASPAGARMCATAAAHHNAALGCIVYISEGRDAVLVGQLEEVARGACQQGGVALASVFVDQPYNRSNFCLVGRGSARLAEAATALSRAALSLLDFRQHEATHPRLGVVDHISCHPLAPAGAEGGGGMAPAADLARAIGGQLGHGEGAVPVYLYAAAHLQLQSLADVRRALGYFRGTAQGQWVGSLSTALPLRPDYGPPQAPARSGVCCVGASPCIVNFNVLLEGVADLGVARRIARGVSERGGGLPSVQAMALQHDQGLEIACNILDHRVTPPEAVEARVRELAAAEGGGVCSSYRIGKSPEELLALAEQL